MVLNIAKSFTAILNIVSGKWRKCVLVLGIGQIRQMLYSKTIIAGGKSSQYSAQNIQYHNNSQFLLLGYPISDISFLVLSSICLFIQY